MKIDLQKINVKLDIPKCLNEHRCFKEFNVSETIECEDYIASEEHDEKICRVENSNPELNIISAKIVDTINATSLEGQRLTGKKLVLSGTVNFSLIVNYYSQGYKNGEVINVKTPFTTFIIIPEDVCDENVMRLRYIIEDFSLVQISRYNIFTNSVILLVIV